MKSDDVIHRGASCRSVRASGCAFKNRAIEPADSGKEGPEEAGSGISVLGGDKVVGMELASRSIDGSLSTGWSICIEESTESISMARGRDSSPSDNCLNIRLTAIIPAAAVSEERSAPTYPGVAFARAVKSKFPSSRSFEERTRSILYHEL